MAGKVSDQALVRQQADTQRLPTAVFQLPYQIYQQPLGHAVLGFVGPGPDIGEQYRQRLVC